MATMDIGVISYNMSVFSAMGYHGNMVKFYFDKDGASKARNTTAPPPLKPDGTPFGGTWPSEARFLRRAQLHESGTSDFFQNALAHLVKKTKELNAKVIGIQEFHPPTLDMVKSAMGAENFEYYVFSKEITNAAKTLTIWDKELLGAVEGEVYDADLGLTEGVSGLIGTDKGRPITIIKTTKGYTLVNFHGINRPKYDKGVETLNDNSALLKVLIAKHYELAGCSDRDANKVIIVCDSNDREHGINRANPILINGAGFHDGHYPRGGAIECCYNFDSCGKPIEPNPPLKESLGADGAEKQYKFPGSYVLGLNFETPTTAEPSMRDAEEASIESDHMLVYAVLKVASSSNAPSGGRRQTRRNQRQRQSQRQNQRQRQSQRQNQRQRQSQRQNQRQRQSQRQNQRQSRR